MGDHCDRNLRYLWRNSCHAGKSDRLHGLAGLSGLEVDNRSAQIPIVCVPGCPVQPDNMMETILYLLYMAVGRAPMIPLDDALRPTWLFGSTVHEGCDRGGYYEQAEFAEEYGSPLCIVKLGMLGTCRAMQCGEARMDGRHRRMPERRRDLHRLHHARLPGQIHALHEPTPGVVIVVACRADVWPGDSRSPPIYADVTQQGAKLEESPKSREPGAESLEPESKETVVQ